MIAWLLLIILISIFSLLSVGMMSYIALATPIGPWVAPLLALIALAIRACLPKVLQTDALIYYAVASGSLGGIMSIALCSSFPTWYFLDPMGFNDLVAHPLVFIRTVMLISVSAGLYGFVLATFFESKLIIQQKLAFPVGHLVFSIVNNVETQTKKIIQLMVGFCPTLIFGLLQQRTIARTWSVAQSILLCKSYSRGFFTLPAIIMRLDTLPMLCSIGFIAGMQIAVPLLCGVLSKIIVVDPLHMMLFPWLATTDFSIAFCSGLMAASTLLGFFQLPTLLIRNYTKFIETIDVSKKYIFTYHKGCLFTTILCCMSLVSLLLFFVTFKFSVLYALYLLGGTAITTYAMSSIAGKIGLAQLGRFATFVMIPGMLVFGIHPMKITLVATFVEIAGGVATDVLFGRKLGSLAKIQHKKLMLLQVLGILLSSCFTAIVLLLLVRHFGLGSTTLFAQRAQARALLIGIQSFNIYALLLGSVYGVCLKLCRLNPLLVFGGIVMPINYCLGLIMGGLLSLLTQDKQRWEAVCSGVFSANSLTELLKIITT